MQNIPPADNGRPSTYKNFFVLKLYKGVFFFNFLTVKYKAINTASKIVINATPINLVITSSEY